MKRLTPYSDYTHALAERQCRCQYVASSEPPTEQVEGTSSCLTQQAFCPFAQAELERSPVHDAQLRQESEVAHATVGELRRRGDADGGSRAERSINSYASRGSRRHAHRRANARACSLRRHGRDSTSRRAKVARGGHRGTGY